MILYIIGIQELKVKFDICFQKNIKSSEELEESIQGLEGVVTIIKLNYLYIIYINNGYTKYID